MQSINTNNQATALIVDKPACYDQMKQCATMTDLIDFVNGLNENDKSGCLLYAIYEKADNSKYISTLATNITKLMPNDMKTLMTLSATGQLDSENAHTLLSTNTAISNTLSVILEMSL